MRTTTAMIPSEIRNNLEVHAGESEDLRVDQQIVSVAMMSARMFRANHPSRVPVLAQSPTGQQSGVLSDSVVMTDNLATVLESAVSRVIGSLPMAEVDLALRHTLGL